MIKTQNFLEVNIETPRLVLQPVDISWAKQIWESFDDKVSKYMNALPDRSMAQTQQAIQQAREEMANGKSLHLIASKKESKEFLGRIALYNIPTRQPEFGLWIKKEAHGNWYGRECVHNLLDWAVQHLVVDYFVYPVDKRNIPSLKIPEFFNGRVGRMYAVQTKEGRKLDILEYHIPLAFK